MPAQQTIGKALASTAVFFALLLSLQAAEAESQSEGLVLYEENFSSPSSLAGWSSDSFASIAAGEGLGGKSCLKIVSRSENESSLVARNIDLKTIRGESIVLEAQMRGENVSKPKEGWLGPKLMLHIESPSIGDLWLDQKKIYGSFPWTKTTVFIRVPGDATNCVLMAGLQNSSGSLWLTGLKITALRKMAQPASESRSELSKSPRFRGVMSGNSLEEKDFKELGEVWKANLMRFQLNKGWNEKIESDAQYDAWLDRQLDKLDKISPLARKRGISLVLDLHAAPMGKQGEAGDNSLSWTFEAQDKLVAAWEKIAGRCKNLEGIYGYDILNEPREDGYVYEPNGPLDWNRLAERVAKAIRKIDPKTPIVVEPAPWGMPWALSSFTPIDAPNVVYSIHCYLPLALTHQGVGWRKDATGISYPGNIEGELWNKERIRAALKPALDFQRKWNVPIYVGEFSCIRWAPGDSAPAYLKDSIELFEEYGWDWTYHAFREWEGWDVDYEGEFGKLPVFTGNSARKAVLLEFMKHNVKEK